MKNLIPTDLKKKFVTEVKEILAIADPPIVGKAADKAVSRFLTISNRSLNQAMKPNSSWQRIRKAFNAVDKARQSAKSLV